MFIKNARYLELTAQLLDLQSELAAVDTANPQSQTNIRVLHNQVIDGKLSSVCYYGSRFIQVDPEISGNVGNLRSAVKVEDFTQS